MSCLLKCWPNFQFVCLCLGLTSQSTIFQSCQDGATASWVINQYFRGVKCLAQGHNTAAVGFEPPTSRSGVRHSTTEPPRSPAKFSKGHHSGKIRWFFFFKFNQVIYSSSSISWPSFKPLAQMVSEIDILLISLKYPNFQRALTPKK